MKATYEFYNNDSEWEHVEIDTDNIDNDSGADLTGKDLEDYVTEVHQQNQESVRNFQII